LRALLGLLRTELTVRVRDRSFWLETLLLPLVITGLMGFALQGVSSGKLPPLRVGIVTENGSDPGVVALKTAYQAIGSIDATIYKESQAAEEDLVAGDIDSLVRPDPVLISDPLRIPPVRAEVQSSIRTQFASTLVADMTESALRLFHAEMETRARLAQGLAQAGRDPMKAWQLNEPFVGPPTIQARHDGPSTALATQFAGLSIFFCLLSTFRLMSNSFGLHRLGLLRRLRLIPGGLGLVSLSFWLSVSLVALTQTMVVLGSAWLFFNVTWHSTPLFLLGASLSAMSSTAVALCLAVLPISPTARGVIGLLVVLVGGLLGGAFIPVQADSGWILTAAQSTLHYWVTTLFSTLAAGSSLEQASTPLLIVTLYGTAALCLGLFLAGKEAKTHA
jgi:ABC-2 type transport system permease protein